MSEYNRLLEAYAEAVKWNRANVEPGLQSTLHEVRAARAALDAYVAGLEEAVARLWVLLDECSDDLWCEVHDRYGDDVHPALQYKYERDMDVVTRAHEALSLTAPLVPSPFDPNATP
jgi:hypothetical protein